jgi:DNA polymerase IV
MSATKSLPLNTPPQRKIIHVDMDCFYAAVEMRDNPKFQNIPLAIGGPGNSRSVLCTANYQARKFGIKSAMPSSHAMRLCPQLVIVPPNFKKYKKESDAIKEIFHQYTHLVEPLSLDEAYLDVSLAPFCQGSATLMALEIKNKIFQKTGLIASAGVSFNKFLAKISSDWKKPNGLHVVRPCEASEFIKALDVRKIPGVGKVTEEKLHLHKLYTLEDILNTPLETLIHFFGKYGRVLKNYSHGIDQRNIQTQWLRKSLSLEHTYAQDLQNIKEIEEKIPLLKKELLERFIRYKQKKDDNRTPQKLFIKVKSCDFNVHTVEISEKDLLEKWSQELEYFPLLDDLIMGLFHEGYKRANSPLRLMGLGVRYAEEANNSGPNDEQQLRLL